VTDWIKLAALSLLISNRHHRHHPHRRLCTLVVAREIDASTSSLRTSLRRLSAILICGISVFALACAAAGQGSGQQRD